MTEPKPPELLVAAQSLADALAAFNGHVDEVRRTRLTTERGISRATRSVQQAVECHQRVDASVQALLEALKQAQVRQAAVIQELQGLAVEIQRRSEEGNQLSARLQQLGEDTRAIHALLVRPEAGEGGTAPLRPPPEQVEKVQAQMDALAAQARTLHEDAGAKDFPDIARQADSFRQAMESARRKLVKTFGGR